MFIAESTENHLDSLNIKNKCGKREKKGLGSKI